jgi:TonB family protein
MMTVLLESSGARGPRRTPWAAASLTLHAALIAAAIVLTTQATGAAIETDKPTDLPIFIPMPQEPAERTRPSGQPVTSTFDPPPTVPITVPSIPTFDASVPFSPAPVGENEIFGRSVPGDVAPRGGETVGNGIHSPATVDRIASALPGNGQPRYPSTLQRIQLEGEVLVRFVVDSAGRVEQGSVTVVEATHPLFADAVRDWLPRTRYAPAEIGATPVRQLVQQTIGFTLKR